MRRNAFPISVVLTLLVLAPLARPQEPSDTPAAASAKSAAGDREEITRAIHDSIGWALTKDRARLESILAHDEDLFMFNPDAQPTVGWDQFVTLFDFWMDPRFKATHFDVRDLRIHFSRSGDAAWFSAILDDCWEWDGAPGCWKDTRWTGVLEERDGAWIIVQMHFSFAAGRGADSAEAASAPPG